MKTKAVLCFVLSFASCNACLTDYIILGPEWAPLRRIQKNRSIAEGHYVVYEDTVFTGDICDFTRRSMWDQNGILMHERVHAKHQQEMGLDTFLRRFNDDPVFRLREEREAWSGQIRYLVRHGERVNPYYVASFFTDVYQLGPAPEHVAWVASEISAGRR